MDGSVVPFLRASRTTDDILRDTVVALHDLADRPSWESAIRYYEAYEELKGLEPFVGKSGNGLTRVINNALRAAADAMKLSVPRSSFMSDARKLAAMWPEVFRVNTKKLPYEVYRAIAICSLPREDRDRLRDWAEAKQPRQAELRQRIREEVDARNDIYKPDFELKTTNFWKFNAHDPTDDYGAVHGLLYANLLYWFSQPGDTVLDPMAGTGTLGRVLGRHRFFRESYQAEGSGPRHALMSDIKPSCDGIHTADATKSLPFAGGVAQLAIIDPPYLRIADGKAYQGIGGTLEAWLANLETIILNTLRCLAPGGLVAILTDDVLRKDEHEPLAYRVTGLLDRLGCKPRTTIYNHNPNFIYTMGPAQMLAARKAKLLVNGCKVIQLASEPA